MKITLLGNSRDHKADRQLLCVHRICTDIARDTGLYVPLLICGCPLGRRDLLSALRKDIEHIIVCRQGCRAQGACLDAPGGLFTREIEDGFQHLLAVSLIGLTDNKEHTRAVLYVARTRQLLLQKVHDEPGLFSIETPGVATDVSIAKRPGSSW